jgi:hypothetical protein
MNHPFASVARQRDAAREVVSMADDLLTLLGMSHADKAHFLKRKDGLIEADVVRECAVRRSADLGSLAVRFQGMIKDVAPGQALSSTSLRQFDDFLMTKACKVETIQREVAALKAVVAKSRTTFEETEACTDPSSYSDYSASSTDSDGDEVTESDSEGGTSDDSEDDSD